MRWLDKSWVGSELSDAAIAELAIVHEQTGLDLCAEEGEHHTVVLDGPSFRQGIEVRSFSVRLSGSVAYTEFQQCKFPDKWQFRPIISAREWRKPSGRIRH